MPITFDEANDIWELTDPTQAEKESLTKVAIEEITNFFGGELANKIVHQAKIFAEEKLGQKDASEFDAKPADSSFSTGEVGNS